MESSSAAAEYAIFAETLQRTCVISDPWIHGRERFRLRPVVLESALYADLSRAAERLGRLYEEFCRVIEIRPEYLDSFFELSPYQKLMWLASDGRWHGIARLDLFVLSDGTIRMCEMNSDTPSGEAEAVLLNSLLFDKAAQDERKAGRELADPNDRFAERFISMLRAASAARVRENAQTNVAALVYPTEMPEDLSMIALYKQWLESDGWRVVTGAPYNLGVTADGRATMFEETISLAVRHYKTDWWGERIPVWSDAPEFPDPEPLDKQLRALLDAEFAGSCTVINPFGAVLTQNKLSMAFFWSHFDLFSRESQNTIRAYVPETFRFADIDVTALDKNEWVLKSDYGCEGDEVIIGRFTSSEQWEACLAAAEPKRWIAQRFFEAAPEEGTELIPNYGLYLIAGKTAGIFTRLSPQATDYTSLAAPTFTRTERAP